MRVAIGADHAGYPLKSRVIELLGAEGHSVLDLGTHGPEPVDYRTTRKPWARRS